MLKELLLVLHCIKDELEISAFTATHPFFFPRIHVKTMKNVTYKIQIFEK